jgi:hypothetical protein
MLTTSGKDHNNKNVGRKNATTTKKNHTGPGPNHTQFGGREEEGGENTSSSSPLRCLPIMKKPTAETRKIHDAW